MNEKVEFGNKTFRFFSDDKVGNSNAKGREEKEKIN